MLHCLHRYEFYKGTVLAATTKSNSYTFGASTLSEGKTVVTVRATDDQSSVSDTVIVSVDPQAADFDPSASIFGLDVQSVKTNKDSSMLSSMISMLGSLAAAKTGRPPSRSRLLLADASPGQTDVLRTKTIQMLGVLADSTSASLTDHATMRAVSASRFRSSQRTC